MTQKDRLIELLHDWGTKNTDGINADSVAEHLIENNVMVLPCKVDDLINKCNKLTQPTGDQAETYTTGYENGYRNGQTELIAYLLQLDTGVRNEAEKALKGGAE